MNIFVLSKDPKKSAKYHCDKHVRKMILETAQILSTILRLGGIEKPYLYKSTHKNHPCVIWASQSYNNAHWLYSLGCYLGDEFLYRWGKSHKSVEVILKCGELLDKINYPHFNLTPFAQAMPDDYKHKNPVKAYRDYYRYAKTHLLTYTKRRKPKWLE